MGTCSDWSLRAPRSHCTRSKLASSFTAALVAACPIGFMSSRSARILAKALLARSPAGVRRFLPLGGATFGLSGCGLLNPGTKGTAVQFDPLMPHLGKIGSTQDLRVIDSSDAAVTGGLSFWVDNASIVSVSPQGVLTYKSPGVVRVYVRSGAFRDSILMQSIRGFDVSPTGITGTGLAVAALNS